VLAFSVSEEGFTYRSLGTAFGTEYGKESGGGSNMKKLASDGLKYVAVLLTCKSASGDL